VLQLDGTCLALALRPMALVCEVEAEWNAQFSPQVSHAPTPFFLIHLCACSTRRETDAEWGMHRPMAMPARRWNRCACNA
jgi:hypothetical protein